MPFLSAVAQVPAGIRNGLPPFSLFKICLTHWFNAPSSRFIFLHPFERRRPRQTSLNDRKKKKKKKNLGLLIAGESKVEGNESFLYPSWVKFSKFLYTNENYREKREISTWNTSTSRTIGTDVTRWIDFRSIQRRADASSFTKGFLLTLVRVKVNHRGRCRAVDSIIGTGRASRSYEIARKQWD